MSLFNRGTRTMEARKPAEPLVALAELASQETDPYVRSAKWNLVGLAIDMRMEEDSTDPRIIQTLRQVDAIRAGSDIAQPGGVL